MRGMKKWLPFKSLNGQYQLVEEMIKERKKQEKPDLSIDQIDELNQMMTSLHKGDDIKVTYFSEGMIIHKKTVFIRCDGYSQTIFFRGFSLPFSSLMSLEQ